MKGITKTFDIGDGRTITLETGKLAKQADGSVVVKHGNTMLLATVVSSPKAKEGVDFLPLSVDYQEKFAATGRFPGGFFKREAKLSDYEVLISRLVDRALRPQFPEDYHADTQVMISLISADRNIMPDALACLAACAALTVSDIPFNGPVSEVRVGRIDGKFKINPTISDMEKSDMDMIVAASPTDIVMVEGEMKEVSEADMLAAIKFAHEAIKVQCKALVEFAEQVGKKPVRAYEKTIVNEELKERVRKATYDKIYKVAAQGNPNKNERKVAFTAVLDEFMASLSEEEKEEIGGTCEKYFYDLQWEAVRRAILDEGKRLDGRKTVDIRPIWSEVDYLPAAHGSAIFTRGETQSLTTVTLGTKLDSQTIDGAIFQGNTNFLLHYNFPGFSTGEVKPNRGVGRREVGHGNLALRALKNILPKESPYTIRIVSDILESNGSSSMATVCAGTLALMDAGIKISKPVAGIAMGLITDNKGKNAVLSDILGDEDHLGDMDFKVTGTTDGITACQMDLKVYGLPYEVMEQALEQARKGRLHILGEMAKTITAPKSEFKAHAPRVEQIIVAKEFIGAIIGPGGKIIQEMQRETGATITIEEVNGTGVVDIFCDNAEGLEKAKSKIKGIVAIPEIGETYHGTVKSIQAYGAFVEFMPGKDALLHISEIDWKRVDNVSEYLKEGDKLHVKLIGVDEKTGKFKLSRRALISKPQEA
ncbi:MAG: polyribonucleotide nucleotidyltransferase [Bacteroidetes bacterium]|nr:polyribonucleotide nucleotidyltransferase [Bacteroidota bacterium]